MKRILLQNSSTCLLRTRRNNPAETKGRVLGDDQWERGHLTASRGTEIVNTHVHSRRQLLIDGETRFRTPPEVESGKEVSEDIDRKDPRNTLNDLSGKKWIQETKSAWFQKGLGSNHPDTRIERQHPAPFSFQDVSRLINFFTKSGGYVLDPFCGVASTLKACACTNRRGLGIELTKKWVELGKERLRNETEDGSCQKIIQGDCREVLPRLKEEEFDFVITSPPYWGILRKDNDHKTVNERVKKGFDTNYSDDPKDLGNIPTYSDFKIELEKIFTQCYRVLKPKKYVCLVVSDFRHGSDFVPFHADVISCMANSGFQLEGINILVQNAKKLYPYGYPYAFVSNIHHQYILIFRKNGEKNGNPDHNHRTITI
jgi:DNA modification methylase